MGSCLRRAGGGRRDGDRVRCITLLKRNDDVIALYYLCLNAILFRIDIRAFTFARYLSACGGDRLKKNNRVML